MTNKQHRYGELIATYEGIGRFYWCQVLEIVTFVPSGQQLEAWTDALSPARNNHLGACRVVARFIDKWEAGPRPVLRAERRASRV